MSLAEHCGDPTCTSCNSYKDVIAVKVDPANPKQAFGDKKVQLQLVPPALDLSAAKGLTEGAGKYGPYNWRSTKIKMTVYIAALKRHLAALQDGEDVDPESPVGKLHIDGLAANVAILADAWYGGFLVDDRPPNGPGGQMVRTPGDPGRTSLLVELVK